MLLPNRLPKLQKSFLRERRVSSEATKVVPKGAQSKFRSSKVVPKRMQSQNITEIEGEEASKSFLKGMQSLNTTEIKGEEAPKSFLWGCRA
jgi:hypothetical protein